MISAVSLRLLYLIFQHMLGLVLLLVRQPQVVMFAALPLVMVGFGAESCGTVSARPVIGMGSGVIRMG